MNIINFFNTSLSFVSEVFILYNKKVGADWAGSINFDIR